MTKSRSLKQSEEKGLRALMRVWLSIPIGTHGFPGVTGTALRETGLWSEGGGLPPQPSFSLGVRWPAGQRLRELPWVQVRSREGYVHGCF